MNFFHSSLRINIECAFGMLVHRWGILRKPMPVNFTVHKISSLVLALCKLHNSCMDNGSDSVDSPSEADLINITTEGGLFLPRLDNSGAYVWDSVTESCGGADRLDDLLDGGEHMDNHTRDQRRVYRAERDLPCYRILDYFYEQSLERPELSAQRLANNRNNT